MLRPDRLSAEAAAARMMVSRRLNFTFAAPDYSLRETTRGEGVGKWAMASLAGEQPIRCFVSICWRAPDPASSAPPSDCRLRPFRSGRRPLQACSGSVDRAFALYGLNRG